MFLAIISGNFVRYTKFISGTPRMNSEITYQEKRPSKYLEDVVHSFWTHKNTEGVPQKMTISPDSFFKIIFLVKENRITNYFMTGIWTNQKDFTIPSNTSTFGCRLKILAPEYLINEEIESKNRDYPRREDLS